MKTKFITVLLLLVVLLVSAIPLCGLSGCVPPIRLTINNHTNTDLNVLVFIQSIIHYAPYEIGTLSAGQSSKFVAEEHSWEQNNFVDILALDNEGYLAFYRVFTRDEVQGQEGKITITDEAAWQNTPFWANLWGEPPWKIKKALPIRVQNHTSESLDITIRGTEIGTVEPGEEISNHAIAWFTTFEGFIRAKNNRGNIVYEKEFTYNELESIDFLIIITITSQ